MHVKRGDMVQVISGDDKGKRGEIIEILRKKGKVVVKGVNICLKHIKRGHPKAPQGGRIEFERPIYACKVSLIDPTTDKPTRVGIRVLADGNKERFAKKSGASLGLISRPQKKIERTAARLAAAAAKKAEQPAS
jgi:large subunit ribosomal protein L24